MGHVQAVLPLILAAVLSVAGLQPPSGTAVLGSSGDGISLPLPPGEYSYIAAEIAEGYAAALLYRGLPGEPSLEATPLGARASALLPAPCQGVSAGVEPRGLEGLAVYTLEPEEGLCRVTLRVSAAAAPMGPLAVYASAGGAAAVLVTYPLAPSGGAAASPEPGVGEAPESQLGEAGGGSGSGDGSARGESLWAAIAISLAVLAVSLVAELGLRRR